MTMKTLTIATAMTLAAHHVTAEELTAKDFPQIDGYSIIEDVDETALNVPVFASTKDDVEACAPVYFYEKDDTKRVINHLTDAYKTIGDLWRAQVQIRPASQITEQSEGIVQAMNANLDHHALPDAKAVILVEATQFGDICLELRQ